MYKKNKIVSYIILFLSICLICLGIANKEAKHVYQNAKTICLDCIGIG